MKKELRVLILEDNEFDAELIINTIEKENFNLVYQIVSDKNQYQTALYEFHPQIILADYSLPQFTGFEALKILKESKFEIPFILITGSLDDIVAANVARDGAWDFVKKDHLAHLVPSIKKFLELQQEKENKRRVEKELSESVTLFRSIAENIPGVVGIYDWYPDGHRKMIYQGPGMEKIVGEKYGKEIYYNPDRYFQLIPEADAEKLENAAKKAYKNDEELDCEYRLEVGDRKFVWVRSCYKKQKKENGVIRWIGLILDITERKQYELKLAKSEENFRELFENAIDIIWTSDRKGKYISVNKQFKRILGYGEKELIGKYSLQLVHPKDREVSKKYYSEVLKGNEIEYEIKVGTKSGKYLDFWLTMRPLFDDQEIIGVHGIGRDISDRKEAERSLQKSRKRYLDIFESTGTATLLIEENTMISLANTECEQITGYPAEELIGTKWTEYVHHDDLKIMLERHKARRKSPNQIKNDYIVRLNHRFLGTRYANLKVKMIKGTKQSIVSLIDITEQKETEIKLKESKNQLSLILDNSPIGVVVNDLKKDIVDYNKAYCQMLGYSAEELKNMKEEELVHPEEPTKGKINFEKLKKGEIDQYELDKRYIRSDGKEVYAHLKAQLVKDENNFPLFEISVVEDITEKVRAERAKNVMQNISAKALSSSNLKEFSRIVYEELGKIMNTTNFYIALYDEELNKYQFIFSVDEYDDYNDLTYHNLENSLTNYVRKTAESLFCTKEKDRQLREELNIKLIGSNSMLWIGAPIIDITENRTLGVIALQSYQSEDLYDQDDLQMLEFVAKNIGSIIEKKRSETALKKSKDQLTLITKILRHDLTNDLAVIKSALKMYQRDQKKYYLDEAEKKVEKGLLLINQMRKQETFMAKYSNLIQYNLRSVLKEISQRYSDMKINIIGNSNVFADRTIYSIFDNLIDNARIHGESDKIDLIITENESRCIVEVHDYGKTIPEEYKEKIFEEGFVFGNTGHSGIGLNIVKTTMEKYGGYAKVKDNDDGGSSFILNFKRAITK